jgi:uncharacterized membrane protein YhaH (DUF805 family)
MGSFSIWHWLVVLLFIVPNLMFIPAVRKTGFSPWWVVLSFIPILGLVVLWMWAYAKWPAQPDR